jgi:site-specific recombinase XerC
MPNLSVVPPSAATPLSRLVDDYLAAARAAGASPKTIRFSYGFPLREVFLPWAAERGLQAPTQLDNRVLDDFTIHLREHGGKRGPLSEHSIWTYVKAVNRFVRWLREEGEEVQTDGRKLPKLPKKLVTVLSRSDIARLDSQPAQQGAIQRDQALPGAFARDPEEVMAALRAERDEE